MNRIIPLKIQDEHIKKSTNIAGAAGSFHVVTLELTFSETWANTAKKVYFFNSYGENPVCIILTDAMRKPGTAQTYSLTIPPEPLARAGEMTLTISGADTKAVPARMILSARTTFEVLPSELPGTDHAPAEPTPGLSDQLQSEINALKAGIDTVKNGLSTVDQSVTASASSATAASNSASQSEAAKRAADAARLSAEAASNTASTYARQSGLSADAAAQSAKDAATALKPSPPASSAKILDTATKIEKFLQADKTDINYQYLYAQYQEFISGSTTGTNNVQASNRDGKLLYWTDETHKTASTDVSAFPVYVYEYKETTKLKFGFRLDPSGSGFYIPLIELGEGNGVGNRAKGFIYKGINGLYLDYYSDGDGSLRRIVLGDNGILLTPYDLQAIGFYNNGFSAKYSGQTISYTWTLDTTGKITALTTADQMSIPVTWNTTNL